MKEFVEKLMERLEEYTEYDTFDIYKEEPLINISFETLDDIVNQLAEEYINCSTDTSTNTSSGWIPCIERLPLFIDNVLVCTKSGGRTVACLTTGKRFCDTYMNIIDNVVAWMPLPPAYVSEEGRG